MYVVSHEMNELYIKLKSNTSIPRSLKALISSEDGSSVQRTGAPDGTLDPPSPPQADIVPHTPDRIVVVKSSIAGIHWRDDLIPILNNFVTTVHNTTMHAYAFAKYIFMSKLESDPNFDFTPWIHTDFFAEVWLSLVQQRGFNPTGLRTATFREVINSQIGNYLRITGYQKITFSYAQQTARIEGKKIYVSYVNNIKTRFGQHLRRLINVLLDVKSRKAAMTAQLIQGGITEQEAKAIVNRMITVPSTQFKEAISHRNVVLPQSLRAVGIYVDAYNAIRKVLEAYRPGYTFRNDNFYYDSKASPVNHFSAFYKLACVFDQRNIRLFRCFPLRRKWSPSYAQIDTKIVCQNILERRWYPHTNKLSVWREVVDLNLKAFKNQGLNHQLQFRGTIQTDGVGVSIIRKSE